MENEPLDERIPTGIEGLDTVLNGGLRRGSAYLVNGPPGAGKTILANQFCFNQAHRGRRALYVGLLTESHDRMVAHMRSMSFYRPDLIPDALLFVSGLDTLQQHGTEGLLRLIGSEMRRHRAEVAVLDGLFAASQPTREREFQRFVHEAQGLAAMAGGTMLLLTNASRPPSSPEYTMVDGWIELLDEMHGGRTARSLVVRKQRGGFFLRGRHPFRIGSDGIRVFPRTEALLDREPPAASQTARRLSTGIAALDAMLGGGLPEGSATMLLGPSGTGKTTMGLQFLAGCTPEEPGLHFGFYETPARLLAKARSIGVDLEGLVARGAVEILWQSPAECLADELASRLLAAVERRKARRIFFDGINALDHAFLFPERLPVYLAAINNALRTVDASIVYTMKTAELFLPVRLDPLSWTVENIVLLHYALRDEVIRRRVSILKVRDSEFDAFSQEFTVTGRGVEIGEAPPAAAGRGGRRAAQPTAQAPGRGRRR